jgi:DNA-binding NarL/FixJ family response regulator
VIFVSGERREPFDRVAGLLIGADDYVVKPFDPDELLARVHAVLRRAGPVGTAEDVSSAADLQLTPREQEVLSLLAGGTRQLDIAGELFISSKTVATHIQRILGKLGVHSRAEAVALAHQRNLVDVADAEDVRAHLAGAG